MLDKQQFILKISYFIVKNKIFFKRFLSFTLFFLDILVVISFSVYYLNYHSGTLEYQEIIRQLSQDYINYDYIRSQAKPKQLEVVKSHIIRNNDGTTDLVALVKNPNINWRAGSLEYRFYNSKGSTEYVKSFLMPGQEKYLMVFKQNVLKNPTEIKVDFKNIAWTREENADKLSLLQQLKATDQKIEVSPDGNSLLKFKVNNLSAYGLWTVGWQVVIFRQTRAVAANYVFVDSMTSQATKDVVLIWLERLETNDKIDIRPDVDLYDSKVFIKPPIKSAY